MEIESIGFIGLGVMGKPMARNLLNAGFKLRLYNRSAEACEQLSHEGGEVQDSLSAIARNSDVIITMLPDSPDVQSVMLDSGGIISKVRPGQVLIDMSTIAPETATMVARAADAKGAEFLDAPVSGGEQGAIDGTLSIMVGGRAETFGKVSPLFEILGSTVAHVGPVGSGQLVKAANQLLVAGIIELVSEALVLLESQGLNIGAALRVLTGGLAGNQILAQKGTSMLERRFEPGFRVDLHNKDLRIVLATARNAGVALPVTALVAQLFAVMGNTGRDRLDHTALFLLLEELAGRGGGHL